LEGLEGGGYGLRLAILDEKRERAGERLTRTADAVEEASEGAWTALHEGDLVLLRKFRKGSKLEPLWEGPYRLVDLAYHSKSGRLQDITTGEIVQVKSGGLQESIHVNDMKLYAVRDSTRIPASVDSVEVSRWRGEMEKERGGEWDLLV
jgi:hypothetical protein